MLLYFNKHLVVRYQILQQLQPGIFFAIYGASEAYCTKLSANRVLNVKIPKTSHVIFKRDLIHELLFHTVSFISNNESISL